MHRFKEPKQAAPIVTEATENKGVLLQAVANLGVPLGIFGAVLFVMSIVLTSLLTPDRFPVRIGERVVRLADLEHEQKALLKQQADLNEARSRLASESEAPVLRQVEKLRETIIPVGTVLLSIDDVRRSFAASGFDPISLPRVDFHADSGVLTLSGDVKDRNGRSVQLLSSFVDGIRAIPFVKSVSEPEYKQTLLPDGSGTAPFTFNVTLSHG